MNVIDLEILIPASPEFIWRFLGDLAALPQWQENVATVSFLSTQRDGRGARWRASSDNNSDVVVEVSAWYDRLGFEYIIKDGTSFAENQGRIRLHEVPDGTLVRWTFQYELKGMLGGLRNAMRIKRGTTNQIQTSLQNLHQLILQESGGISTHEAKASVKEAPDVDERSSYQPRHPSAFHDPALDETEISEIQTDTDKLAAVYEAESVPLSLPPVADTDTKPNPVVLAPDFGLDFDSTPEAPLDDTKPLELAGLLDVAPLPTPEPVSEPPIAVNDSAPPTPPAEISPPPPRQDRDTANLSVFEIFGLQKPSEAHNLDSLLKAPPRKSAPLDEPFEPSSRWELGHRDKRDHGLSTVTVAEARSEPITGLRRRGRRRRTLLRTHT